MLDLAHPFLQKAAAIIAAATIVGGGTIVLNTATKLAVVETKVASYESSQQEIRAITVGVATMNGKIDVLNQKVDDLKPVLVGAKR